MQRFDCRPAGVILLFLSLAAPATPAAADLWGISTDDQYSRVIRFDHETGAELPGGIPTNSAGLVAPSGITVGPNGTIYVSSRGMGMNTPKVLIYSCDDAGNCDPASLPGGTPGVFADLGVGPDPAAPAQLRFGPDRNLYVSELFGQKVRVYDPADGTRLADAASGLPGSGGITFEANGNLLVGTVVVPDFMIPATISRFTGGTQNLPFFVATMGELSFAASLLFLPNGDLLAVDLFADRIVRFDGSGTLLDTFATIPTIIAGKPSFPSDIVYDPDGNLIVAVLGPNNPEDPEGNQGQLLRYDLNGNLLETIADQLEQIGGLAWTASPETLSGDYDHDGDFDVLDYNKWKGDFGKWVAPANGADGNGNGIVDAGDYTIWRDALGSGGGSAGAANVPEPAGSVLAAVGILLSSGLRSLSIVRKRFYFFRRTNA